MELEFQIGELFKETRDCHPLVEQSTERLCRQLEGLSYRGETRPTNSFQLDIHFDDALFDVLRTRKWICERNPIVDVDALGSLVGRQSADAVLQAPATVDRIVLEIEKANKKTIWFDFIKVWMFIESGQADVGIVLCPLNYSHKLSVWNLFDEARKYKAFLGRFAAVPDDKLAQLGLIGYRQMINVDGEYHVWNSDQFKRVKKDARSRSMS